MILNCGSLLQTILALPNCMAAASAAFSRNIRVFWLTVTRSQRQFKTMIIIYDEIVKHLNWFFFLICSINYQLPQHKKLIIDAGALPCLVDLLRRHKSCPICSPLVGLLRIVANAICYLASDNTNIKTLVRFVFLSLFFHAV